MLSYSRSLIRDREQSPMLSRLLPNLPFARRGLLFSNHISACLFWSRTNTIKLLFFLQHRKLKAKKSCDYKGTNWPNFKSHYDFASSIFLFLFVEVQPALPSEGLDISIAMACYWEIFLNLLYFF